MTTTAVALNAWLLSGLSLGKYPPVRRSFSSKRTVCGTTLKRRTVISKNEAVVCHGDRHLGCTIQVQLRMRNDSWRFTTDVYARVNDALAEEAFDVAGDDLAAGAATRVIYDPATGALYFDGTGGAASMQVATLNGLPTIVAGDVVVGA